MKRKVYNPPVVEVFKPYGLSLLATLSTQFDADFEGFEEEEWV